MIRILRNIRHHFIVKRLIKEKESRIETFPLEEFNNEMNKGDVVEAVFIMENFTRKCKNYNNTCLIELFCNECPFNGINSH